MIGWARRELRELERELDRPLRTFMPGRFPRKTPDAGIMEAAGIEPACNSLPKPRLSRDFLYTSTVAGYRLRVQRDGKHLNFHIFDHEEGMWRFEPIESALPKLEALVEVARLAQEAHDGTD